MSHLCPTRIYRMAAPRLKMAVAGVGLSVCVQVSHLGSATEWGVSVFQLLDPTPGSVIIHNGRLNSSSSLGFWSIFGIRVESVQVKGLGSAIACHSPAPGKWRKGGASPLLNPIRCHPYRPIGFCNWNWIRCLGKPQVRGRVGWLNPTADDVVICNSFGWSKFFKLISVSFFFLFLSLFKIFKIFKILQWIKKRGKEIHQRPKKMTLLLVSHIDINKLQRKKEKRRISFFYPTILSWFISARRILIMKLDVVIGLVIRFIPFFSPPFPILLDSRWLSTCYCALAAVPVLVPSLVKPIPKPTKLLFTAKSLR